jgi:hypothetical protein
VLVRRHLLGIGGSFASASTSRRIIEDGYYDLITHLQRQHSIGRVRRERPGVAVHVRDGPGRSLSDPDLVGLLNELQAWDVDLYLNQ